MVDNYNKVTILLPAMDETYSLTQTVDTIVATCEHDDLCEFILLLCNRTTPACVETAERLCAKYNGTIPTYIHYQTLPFVGGAIREGFSLARGSHVVLMSSDLETDPLIISEFIKQAKSHPNTIITASRWQTGMNFQGYNKIKLIANFIFQKMIALLFFTRLSDITYAFRIFPVKLVNQINWEELKHPFFLETALKPLRLKVPFIEVPASWKARTEGHSVNSFWANFAYLKTAWHVRFMKRSQIKKNVVRK